MIAARYMGAGRAEEFGRRNAVPGELVVRLRPVKVLASFDALDNTASLLALDEHGTELVIGKARQFFERWDLRRLRAELAKLNLDWDLPPLPAEDAAASD